jgi:hypothetical protein
MGVGEAMAVRLTTPYNELQTIRKNEERPLKICLYVSPERVNNWAYSMLARKDYDYDDDDDA